MPKHGEVIALGAGYVHVPGQRTRLTYYVDEAHKYAGSVANPARRVGREGAQGRAETGGAGPRVRSDEYLWIGPAGAARILADVGDIARFPDRNHFASWTGTAPIDASSGERIRHRLSRAGNRRLNHVLYMAAFVQLRHETEGRAYYRRKLAAGKTPMEAMRCLKRRLSDVVYRQLVTEAARRQRAVEAGPGGHRGATLTSSAADLTPHADTSDQPQPGPAPATLRRAPAASTSDVASTAAPKRRRARGVNVQRPTGRTTLTPTSAGAP